VRLESLNIVYLPKGGLPFVW